MVPLTRSGKQVFFPFALLIYTFSAAYAQTPAFNGQCAVTSVPVPARAEGLTEKTGDILLQCSGSTPGAVLAGNLTVALPVSVTNRIGSTNLASEVVLSADLGSGFVPLPTAPQILDRTVIFNGLSLTTPASGRIGLRISNIRAAVSQLSGSSGGRVQAQIAFAG